MVTTLPTPRACGWRSLARNTNRPLTSSVTTTARSRQLQPTSALRRMKSCDDVRPSPQQPEACALRPVKSDQPPLQDAFCHVAHDVLRPRRNSNADSTPRIEPLASVHRGLVRTPHRRGERTSPWLDRASNAVPVRLATVLHDERNRSSTRDACDQLSANDTSTTGTHASFGDPGDARSHGCMARFTTPHALRMCRFSAFRRGRFLPATSTELASSDAPVTALRLSSFALCIALARRALRLRAGFRLQEETPAHRSEEVSASSRPRPPAHDVP